MKTKTRSGKTPLQAARLAAGWSGLELCRRGHVDRCRLSILETGAGKPSKATALRLAKTLRRDVRELWPDFDSLRDLVRVEK